MSRRGMQSDVIRQWSLFRAQVPTHGAFQAEQRRSNAAPATVGAAITHYVNCSHESRPSPRAAPYPRRCRPRHHLVPGLRCLRAYRRFIQCHGHGFGHGLRFATGARVWTTCNCVRWCGRNCIERECSTQRIRFRLLLRCIVPCCLHCARNIKCSSIDRSASGA